MITSDGPRLVKMDKTWGAEGARVKAEVSKIKRQTKRFDADTDQNGWLGERVFAEFVRNEYPALADTMTWLNESDETFAPYDFELGGLRLDVKSATVSTSIDDMGKVLKYWDYLYPVTQKPLEKDRIVLVYLWPDDLVALIVGSIAGSKVAEMKQETRAVANARQSYKIPNYVIGPLAQQLDDVSELLDGLSKA